MPPGSPFLLSLWEPLRVSLQTAGAAFLLLLPVGVWWAWKLSRAKPGFFRAANETLLLLPLVLPPLVVGYGLLLLFGRGTAPGRFLTDRLHISLVFTWQGAALAAFVMGLPLLVRSAQTAFEGINPDWIDAARNAGATESQIFWRVALPLSQRGIWAGATLAFARALGEFGATLMVAGNIAGQTQTIPLHLYEAVQNGRDTDALRDALLLAAFAWGLGGLAVWWGRKG